MERESKKQSASYDPSQWFSVSKLYEPKAISTSADVGERSKQVNEQTPQNQQLTHDEYEPFGGEQTSASFIPQPLQVEEVIDKGGVTQSTDPRKLDYYITSLQNMIAPLAHEYKKRFPYDMICQLAHAVLDGTVFEITKGLQDIQTITEQNLSVKRMNLLNEHRTSKSEILKRHQNELSSLQNKSHKKLMMDKQHNEEKQLFNQRCEKELTSLDQKLVLELDRQTSDQQATLQRAGLPLFFITNEAEDIKLQMYALSFIIRLAAR